MLVQYLVGLYTLKGHAANSTLNVVLGDMVDDAASDTARDVDVTVTLTMPAEVHAFMGYEVKHWTDKLDVSDVEALVIKMKDMPAVTHRAIVCTSGYTDAAIKKAEYHNVDLYIIKNWDTPVNEEFPIFKNMKDVPAEAIKGRQFYLEWRTYSFFLTVKGPSCAVAADAILFDAAGKKHKLYKDFGTFTDAILVRSTERILFTPPVQEQLAPLMEALVHDQSLPERQPWPYAHTLEIGGDEVYIRTSDNRLGRLDSITVHGELYWEDYPLLYLAMEKVPTGEMFGGAIIALSPVPGRMWAFIFPTEGATTMDIRRIELSRDQLNAIRQLDIAVPKDDSTIT
jgi:hypothetical protein